VRYAADLHVHSRFSRATSRALTLGTLHAAAREKGIGVVATGDFTHPAWLAELRAGLAPAEPGLFRWREAPGGDVRFLLGTEISTVYRQDGRGRRVHHLVFAPDFATVDRLVARLGRLGNLAADGRPILKLSGRDLLALVLDASPEAFLVPAHAWTPWYSIFGEKSGFASLDEGYGDLAPQVFALETGLSSDPAMNYRLATLDRLALISSSDAQSPETLGREATLFDGECSYFALREALRTQGPGLVGTVECFPEQGKYHHAGHRTCGVVLPPEVPGPCPVCGRPPTAGVADRLARLADRPPGFRPARAKPAHHTLPLRDLLAELLGVGPQSQTVRRARAAILRQAGPELTVLLELPVADADHLGVPRLGEALRRLRAGEVSRQPGYDGVYGVIRVFPDG
jgi:DNA helicase-2/ATP-dependent DNA helicase PcrA